MSGGSSVNGGYYSAIAQQYSTVGKTGMSKSELQSVGRQASQAYQQSRGVQTTSNNIAKIMQAANMYGMQLDEASIFNMANTNGDNWISDKEATAFMSKLPQLAYMQSQNGTSGTSQSGGSSGVMGFLNSAVNLAGGLLGSGGTETADASGGQSSGSGNFLNTAFNTVKGWFS